MWYRNILYTHHEYWAKSKADTLSVFCAPTHNIMPSNKYHGRLLLVLTLVIQLGACATTQTVSNTVESGATACDGDPWEDFNRRVFRFNDRVDRAVIKPIAKGYHRVTPVVVRRSVGNFYRNLLEPTTIINALLQGKLFQAFADSGRFLINSTIGVLGLFEVAEHLGLERHQEDFGQTFAAWGFGPGPYLVLPFLGLSTVRDSVGLLPYYFYTDPRLAVDSTGAQVALIGLDVIDYRAQLLGVTRLLQMQLDPYLFARESFRQKRRDLIYDGNPPVDEFLR